MALPVIRVRNAIAALAAAGMFAASAAAQNAEDSVTVTPHAFRVAALLGYQMFDESAALDRAPFIGVRVSRPITDLFSAGLNVTFARPNSRGEYFPWNRQIYFSDASHQNDTTLLFQAEQRITFATSTLDFGVGIGGKSSGNSRLDLGAARFSLNAGIGFWAAWLDPERTRGNHGRGGTAIPLGAEVSIPAGRASSIGVRLEDVILKYFDRNMLSLSDPLLSEDLFSNPVVTPPPVKSTLHNTRLTFMFSFVPGVKEQ